MPQKRFVYEIIQREFLPVNYYKSYVKVDFLEYFHENIYIYFFFVLYIEMDLLKKNLQYLIIIY